MGNRPNTPDVPPPAPGPSSSDGRSAEPPKAPKSIPLRDGVPRAPLSDTSGEVVTVKGVVAEAYPNGVLVRFRNHHGGPYKVAIPAKDWDVPEGLAEGDAVQVALLKCDFAAALEKGCQVVGTPGGERFFVAAESVAS